MPNVIVNGKDSWVAEGSTLSELLTALGLSTAMVAVEINMEIVRKADRGATRLAEGDRIEILHFVGGG